MELPSPRNAQGLSRAGLVLALYGSLAIAAVLVSAWRGDPDLYRFGDKSTSASLALSPLLGLGIGLLIVFLSRQLVLRTGWGRRIHYGFRDILGPLSRREIAVLAVASAVGEELLFRGALLPVSGLWLQAVIFALLHIGPSRSFLPWTLSAFAIGLLFGHLLVWTGDLGAPIVAHFVINYMNLGFITRTELPELSAPAVSDGPATATNS